MYVRNCAPRSKERVSLRFEVTHPIHVELVRLAAERKTSLRALCIDIVSSYAERQLRKREA